MSSHQQERTAVLSEVLEWSRRHSTSTVLFHHVLADCLGLNPTDHKCVDIISQRGPMTAGQLAEVTGLTTGTITAAIDRLEKARFLKRVPDPNDRRRVVLELRPDRFPEVQALFAEFMEAQMAVLERYSTEQLGMILDYVRSISQMVDEQAQVLRQQRGKKHRTPD